MTTRGRVVLITLVVVLGLAGLVTYWIRDAQVHVPVEPACTVAGAPMSVDPTQARSAATIAAVALERGLPERAVVIALATALQESKLYNLDYGDRDSVGLFQQRPSQGWGTAQQLNDPQYASGVFYDALVKIPGWQRRPLTQVAQAVQHSGYPGAYAQWEEIARPLAAALWGRRAAGLSCTYDTPAKTAAPAAVSAALAAELPGVTGAAQVSADRTGSVDYPAPSRQQGWRITAWLVANGDRLGIYSISYAGRTWHYDQDGWDATSDPPGTAVRVSLTPPS